MSEERVTDSADDAAIDTVDVDLRVWVEAARADPILLRDRQVTEVVLTAIGLSPDLQGALILKGGTLMAIAFNSPDFDIFFSRSSVCVALLTRFCARSDSVLAFCNSA